MIIFLYGKDTYRSTQKLNFYLEKFKEKRDSQGTSIVKLDGEELDINEFRRATLSAGLFAQKRMIVIKNLLSKNQDKDRDENQSQKLIEEIIASFKKLREGDNVIVFYEQDEPRKNESVKKLLTLLKKEKYAEEFEPLDHRSLEKWIINEVKKENGQIDRPAINFLAEYFGDNLWALKNEMAKALAYNQNKIDLPTLKLLSETERGENIFAMIDALINKNKKRALELLEKEISRGTTFPQIIGGLAYQFRILLQVKRVGWTNAYALAKKLGVHPFSVKKAIEQSKKYQMEELKKIFQEILNIDLQLKTSNRDPELLFDLLIAKL